ncbi:hypothetical protein [Paenibacillus segetis]|uniref:Uncharacterized protein n=1 Tax=Paenibacillus segetis TaxID=1325360 RepID=A0ABQ1YU94_9BACL|nr:hypothetical protein [Paenibacillus segetis]GGH38038.1 hypothetical protein GCM10008013_45870 [Paenibacillus segetis]
MECIIHFEVVHENSVKELRGLIFPEEGKTPSEKDFLLMFEDMGYKLRLEDRDNLVFKPTDPGAEFNYIRVRKVDTGEKSYKEDSELKSVVSGLLPRESRPL